ncbi:MAG: phosphoribosylamine--glycine ligase [Myxococcales bacterium]|nr:phosphoribosylamine--glycine ligase [Myxococcota bacterium]MDW8284305.1 phosphoribosylamine--glycine ligase [Myxococcales bacterium]
MPSWRKSKILVVGGGGREHALCWRLRQSPGCGELLCAPGNAGIAALPGVRCLPVSAVDLAGLCAVVRHEEVDLVVVGPEAPLHAGLADALLAERNGRTAVFGCSAAAAEIEASKVFAKAFMLRHGIPTAAYTVARDAAAARAFLREQAAAGRHRFVVKADGLRAGKGVTVCDDIPEAVRAAETLLSEGSAIVIEERLVGREASCFALCDGEEVVPLPPCEDHKTLGEGDTGPMTGGMGALCPTPVVDDDLMVRVRDEILQPAARGLVAEGRPFRGLLYAGLMCTAAGPMVLEFNCRFGDPEAQPLLLLWDEGVGDALAALEAVARGQLRQLPPLRPVRGAAVCVVMAAAGYPGRVRSGDLIEGIAEAEAVAPGQVVVFHAGTVLDPSGGLRTAGGRVLGVTARAADLPAARALAYRAAAKVRFAGAQLRRDIGHRT